MNREKSNLPSPTDHTDLATNEVDDHMTEHSDENSRLEGRRRVLKIAVPAILTIASQSALGCTTGKGGLCFTPSRSLSKNTSFTQKKNYGECYGVSPGNYSQQTSGHGNHWPSGASPCTLFYSVFATGPYISNRYYTTASLPWNCRNRWTSSSWQKRSMTMLEVLNLTGNQDPNKVAFHVVGAYLNILNGYISNKALTVQALKDIWSEYAQTGQYVPFAGADPWNGSQIVNYLQNNYIAP